MGQNRGLNVTYQVNPRFHTNTQLQFNLDAPAQNSLQSKFTSPQAILIQHLGPPKDNMFSKGDPKSPVKYMHLSSSKLSSAMQLAKDDLKLAKRRKAVHQFADEHGLVDEYKQQFPKKNAGKHFSLESKTPQRRSVYKEVHIVDKSAQKSSLYGRLKQETPQKVERSSENVELEQLQRQVQECLENLQRVFDQASNIKHSDFDPQEEARLMLKHIEQSRKMSRNLYTLQHQVQTIKSNIGMKNNKNNMNRRVHIHKLSASYRGLLRLLRTFQSSVAEQIALRSDIGTMMYNYNEISKLIREISLCCLGIQASDVAHVNYVLTLLDDIADIDVQSAVTKHEKSPAKSPKKNEGVKKKSIPLKTNKAFSRGYLTPRPQQSTKKRPTSRPSSMARPPAPITSSTPNVENDPNDLFSRPVWVPPSHSPSRHISPMPLGGLGDSLTFPKSHNAAGKKRKVTKNLRFESNTETKEYDIDSLPSQPTVAMHDANLQSLKHDLLKELENKLQKTVNPLLTKVEELASSQPSNNRQRQPSTNDVMMMDALVEDAANEVNRIRMDDRTTTQAHTLQNAHNIESILRQLDTMEREETAIRQKWKQMDYDDVVEGDTKVNGIVEPLSDPQPITYTQTKHQRNKPKVLVKFMEDSVEYSPVEFPQALNNADSSLHDLSLPESSMHAITRSRDDYKRHLRTTFHEAKGSFNPWKLVEDVSDEILDEVIVSVNKEMDDLCNEFASALYRDEFVDGRA